MSADTPDPKVPEEGGNGPAAGPLPRQALTPRGAATPEAGERGGNDPAAGPLPRQAQTRNPLHGVTLEAMLNALVAQHGWSGLGERIPVRCFNLDPSVSSSLRFLRKTPWAREKVEGLYLATLRAQRRAKALK
jgi:hypothetical protein